MADTRALSPGVQAAAEEVADLMKLLGHPQRLSIVCLLSEGDHAVSEIEHKLGIHQPALSQQLGALREAGVIVAQRSARAAIYRLSDERMRLLVAALHRIFCPEGASAFAEQSTQASPRANYASGAASFAHIRPRNVSQ